MFGKPEDVPGECNAHLYIGDDYGDNHATIRCALPKGHTGLHREVFCRETDDGKTSECVVTWEVDERCWHEWMDLRTEEGRDTYFGDRQEEDGEYHRLLERGWLLMCKGCRKMRKVE